MDPFEVAMLEWLTAEDSLSSYHFGSFFSMFHDSLTVEATYICDSSILAFLSYLFLNYATNRQQ